MSGSRNVRRILVSTLSRAPLRSATATFGGLTFRVPLHQGLGAKHLSQKSDWIYDRMPDLLADRPGAFIDIGASIGFYLVRLRSLDRRRPYYGFEANLTCANYVQDLIRHNDFQPASVFAVGLSDQLESRKFYARTAADRMGSLQAPDGDPESEAPFAFELITQPADALLAALPLEGIALIKVDVEGAEVAVLGGLRETLGRYRPHVLCEILQTPGQDAPDREEKLRAQGALLDLIADIDYRVLGVDGDGRLQAVESADGFDGRYERDYVLAHRENVDALQRRWSR